MYKCVPKPNGSGNLVLRNGIKINIPDRIIRGTGTCSKGLQGVVNSKYEDEELRFINVSERQGAK